MEVRHANPSKEDEEEDKSESSYDSDKEEKKEETTSESEEQKSQASGESGKNGNEEGITCLSRFSYQVPTSHLDKIGFKETRTTSMSPPTGKRKTTEKLRNLTVPTATDKNMTP